MSKVLTQKQVDQYREYGYLVNLPRIFTDDEVVAMRQGCDQLLGLLKPGETSKEIREWHETSRFLYDVCMNDRILDYVEGLIGPNFYMWASNFFIKDAHTHETVGWHQDSFYWPLEPIKSCTVWIAFTHTSPDNGAMQVIPGTHNKGLAKHYRSKSTNSVLTLELGEKTVDTSKAIDICLQPGEISIHDDKLIHGSSANTSDRPRIGLSVRYSPCDVRCDLNINPHFKTYHCRGTDRYRHNTVGEVPTKQFGRLYRDHLNVEESDYEDQVKTDWP